MRTHAMYRLRVKYDKILTGLDKIRCSDEITISVTKGRLVVSAANGIYQKNMISQNASSLFWIKGQN